MPNVRMPDGTVVGFPDDMPREQIKGMIAQKFPHLNEPSGFASGTQQRMSEYQGLSPEQAAQKARTGLGETLVGAGRELAGLVTSPTKLAETEKAVLSTGLQAAEHPIQTAQKIGGYYYENPDILATDVAAAITPLGPETGAVRGTEEALSRQGLKQKAVSGIEGAKQSGLEFPPAQVHPVISDIRSELDKMGYDAPTHPRVARALGNVDRLLAKRTTTPEMEDYLAKIESPKRRAQVRLQLMAQGPGHTFKDIHNALINFRPAIKAEGTEGAMGNMMQEKLDDYVFNLPKGPEFQKGMEEYSQARKLDEINAIKERVEIATQRNKTRAGYAHNLALEVDKIARNPKKLRLWKPEEQEHIKSIVSKGNLGQKIAGALGNFAPSGIGRVGIDVVLGHILGSVIPGGTIGLMAMGTVARGIETGLAKKRLSQFEKLVSPEVNTQLSNDPMTSGALTRWANAKGRGKQAATRALAIAIARQAKTPKLVPRIQQELENMDQDNNGRPTSLTPAVNPVR